MHTKTKYTCYQKHLDEKVARLDLSKIGVVLDTLTTAQASHLGLPIEGPFEADMYCY